MVFVFQYDLETDKQHAGVTFTLWQWDQSL